MTLTPNPAWRGDPIFIPELFRQFGINFRELPGWKDWGMGDFNVIQGIFWHHTGHSATSAEYIARNAGLDGGLSSTFHTAPSGLQTLCGAGFAWHAGRGWGNGWPTNNANPVSIGFEMQANGTDRWPEAQLDSTRRASAVILWFLGKRATISTLTSHWEYSLKAQGKWDPGAGDGVPGHLMDMDRQRALVNRYIDNINKYGRLDAQPQKEEISMDAVASITKYIRDFITGFIGPIGADAKDIRQQLTGSRTAGEYPGWPQLGKNAQGQNLTLVDALAATRQDLARIEKKLDQNGVK